MAVVLIGKGILELAPLVTTVTGSVKSIYNLIDSISKHNHSNKYSDTDINELIENLDIRNKLHIYSLLIVECPETKCESIKNSLISVKDIIVDIESLLKIINEKLYYNKNLWIFKSFRSYSISKDMKSLEKYVNKLDSRIESLKIVTEISKLWNSKIFITTDQKIITNTIEMSSFEHIDIVNKKSELLNISDN